ncbi:glycoside hydrolase [Olivibacter sp. SDN3]|nr:glycoside hydrolase [Olivibacter sp. SDN3]
MKIKQVLKNICLAICVIVSQQIYAQTNPWPAIQKEMKPWTRWWWMGNAVDKENINALLEEYHRVGMGGVEIAPIYGAKGYENRYINYLSPEWMEMLRFTTKAAENLDMGVDLTNGTGWPFGGRQVDAQHAATKLIVQKYLVNGGTPLSDKIKSPDQKQPDARLLSLTAYDDKGNTQLLTDKVAADGSLQWQPNTGNWELYATFLGKTKQQVKRAAPGGEGFTLDHLSLKALTAYLQPFEKAFGEEPLGIRAFYNDSYEVYGADWTPDLFDAFQQKRGYDLRLHMRDFLRDDTASDKVARIKSDYRETLAELLLENFTQPWTSWAHKYQGITKNQAHGSPGNLLDLYAAVDIPEAETFGSSYFAIPGLRRDSADVRNVDPDPMMLKFASSAANITGKKYVSCETFTWLTEHFKTSWAQCKPEVEQAFLAGINHVFYHGTTYSPSDAKWPGWLFYASVNFVPANPLWAHLSGLNEYITRVQSVLQTGRADNELLIYWPVYDAWHNGKGRDMPLKVHDIDEWLHPTAFYENAQDLQKEGYAFDFISDKLLSEIHVNNNQLSFHGQSLSHQVLIVPEVEIMPLETLHHLARLSEEGATIIFQSLPKDVPGRHDLEKRRAAFHKLLKHMQSKADGEKSTVMISKNVSDALANSGIKGESLAKTGLQFIRRKEGKSVYYYMVNHTDQAVDKDVALNASGKTHYLLDPLSGKSGLASLNNDGEDQLTRIQLAPGQAILLKITEEQPQEMVQWPYINQKQESIAVAGKWNVRFNEGGPIIPKTHDTTELVSWTSFPDSATTSFSGTATYRLTIDLPSIETRDVLLKVDQIGESARVKVNGKEAGLLWSIPYQLSVGEFLQAGKNEIEIEVANLMANRIRYMDEKQLTWRGYHEINFVDINYEPFDASKWKVMPAGLIGEVQLIPYD